MHPCPHKVNSIFRNGKHPYDISEKIRRSSAKTGGNPQKCSRPLYKYNPNGPEYYSHSIVAGGLDEIS